MHRLAIIVSLILTALSLKAQRNVTPVETDDKKPASPTLHYYDKHGNALDEPVLFLATLDTVSEVKSNLAPTYPKLNALSIGLNFIDGIFAIAGQHYGGADIWADLSIHNRIFPAIEIGVGGAKNTPEGNNYTYKASPSFYAKIGANYNFLYKSSSDYQLFAGLRCGFSSFKFNIEDATVNSGYWGESQTFSLKGFSSTAIYGEALLGLKVKIWERISMGWTFRYHFMIHNSKATLKGTGGSTGDFSPELLPSGAIAEPWYIPGYGKKSSHIGATFSVIYTLPLSGSAHTMTPAPAAAK